MPEQGGGREVNTVVVIDGDPRRGDGEEGVGAQKPAERDHAGHRHADPAIAKSKAPPHSGTPSAVAPRISRGQRSVERRTARENRPELAVISSSNPAWCGAALGLRMPYEPIADSQNSRTIYPGRERSSMRRSTW